MEYDKFNDKMERLARWVFEVLIYHDEDKECPKVGYLGYANGMSMAGGDLEIRYALEVDDEKIGENSFFIQVREPNGASLELT